MQGAAAGYDESRVVFRYTGCPLKTLHSLSQALRKASSPPGSLER